MKNLAFVLAVLAVSAPTAAAAADKRLAPAVTRIPAPASRQACDPAGGASCPQASSGAISAQQYRSALRGAAPAEDAELDNGMTNAMSRLMEAGRCADAVNLAKRAGRGELATRAQQLCK
jgi:hypothetical protein